jgi:hypothetical protein
MYNRCQPTNYPKGYGFYAHLIKGILVNSDLLLSGSLRKAEHILEKNRRLKSDNTCNRS